YRPDFERLAKEHQQGITREMAGIKSLDVRAVADLWDSYMHVLVGVDEQGHPRVKRIEDIRRDGKPIFIGQGAQAALARRILCQYGIFASMDEAREAFKPPTDPVAQANDLQQKDFDDVQDMLRSGELQVAFLLTSTADFRDHLAAKRSTHEGALHLLPIDR